MFYDFFHILNSTVVIKLGNVNFGFFMLVMLLNKYENLKSSFLRLNIVPWVCQYVNYDKISSDLCTLTTFMKKYYLTESIPKFGKNLKH